MVSHPNECGFYFHNKIDEIASLSITKSYGEHTADISLEKTFCRVLLDMAVLLAYLTLFFSTITNLQFSFLKEVFL